MSAYDLIRPAEYQTYHEAGIVTVRDGDHLEVRVQRDWATAGEARLGWTQIVRIVECVRDFHWRQYGAAARLEGLDATVTRLEARFRGPMVVGETYGLSWKVSQRDVRGYILAVEIYLAESLQQIAHMDMRLRFVDSATGQGKLFGSI